MWRSTVRWESWSGDGHEHLTIEQLSDGYLARSVLLGRVEEQAFGLHYTLRCDAAWRFRKLGLAAVDTGRKYTLESDGHGHWRDETGETLPGLSSAVDVDLSFSPLTNTLPIRRLRLEEGEAADIVTAYVAFPGFGVSPDPQRYTCLKKDALYRYASLDSDFTRDVEVDGNGLVTLYPGLFKRTA